MHQEQTESSGAVSRAPTTPQAPIIVELKSRKKSALKSDLDKLERVSRAQLPPPPGSVRAQEEMKPTRRFKFVHTTVKNEELSVLMKGRQIPLNKSTKEAAAEPDDLVDEDLFYIQNNEYANKLRNRLNTPVTSLASPRLLSAGSAIRPEAKPAILPTTGTLRTVKMNERPKPAEKYKTLNPLLAVPKTQKPARKDLAEELRSLENLSESDLEQIKLENEMRALKKEAMEIGGKDIAKRYRDLEAENTDLSGLTDKTAAKDAVPGGAKNEKVLLKSVEGLILAIKSGQLVKEQDQSNKKIQEILSRVLDKESLSLMDPALNETLEEEEEDPDRTVLEPDSGRNLADITNELSERSKTSKHTTESRPSNKLVDAQSGHDLASETKESRSKKSSQVKFDHETTTPEFDPAKTDRNFESILISEESTSKNDTFFSPSFDENDMRLAMLPRKVTYEELMTVPSKRSTLNARLVEATRPTLATSRKDLPLEDRFARNLHLFCMLEHERRSLLMLPEELENVTRKYHTRNRYDANYHFATHSRSESMKSYRKSRSIESGSTRLDTYVRTNEAAQRVLDSLVDEMRLERSASQSRKPSKDESKSCNDSGIGDDSSLDSWRMQAETIIGTKMDIKRHEHMLDFTLNFLRPAPPKMVLRPSQIRRNLFPEYRSVVPPNEEDFESHSSKYSSKKSKSKQRFKNSSSKNLDESSASTANFIEFVDEDEDIEDEMLELETIVERMLKRQYRSEEDLTAAVRYELNRTRQTDETRDEDAVIFSREPRLVRALSDGLLTRKQRSVEDSNSKWRRYDFNEEFLRIDSNYNDAIEEALYQKKKIKDDYMARKKSEELAKKSKASSVPVSEKSKKMQEPVTGPSKPEEEEEKPVKVFFPKHEKKTPAQMALEAGRNYILKPEKAKTRKLQPTGKRLDPTLLDDIEKQLLTEQPSALERSESVGRIKFPKRFKAEDDMLRVPRHVRHKEQTSVPDLLDFEAYKTDKDYQASRWCLNTDAYYDNEREWVRDIWTDWFDQVIPKLDGTIKADFKKLGAGGKGAVEQEPEGAAAAEEVVVNVVDEDDPNRPVKSPTPYEQYEQIDLKDANKPVDLETIKVLEGEIEKLTKRLDAQKSAFDFCRRATLFRKLGFIQVALGDVNEAIEMEDNFVDAYWQRHLIYLVQNKTDEALDDLNTILKLNRAHSGAYLSRGDIYSQRNDTQMAIVNYSQAIKYRPNDFHGYFKRAKIYELRGELRMAMDDYLTTTKLNPRNSEAWFKHGMNYFNNKNWHYAIVDFTELIKHNPSHQAQARLFRGKCYYFLKEFQAALDDFSIALHLNPNDWESYYYRACILQNVDSKQALQDYSVSLLIESGYENISAFLHRAILYYNNEEFDEAIRDYESALRLDKEFAPAYVNLGIIYMNVMLNYWKAIKHFNLAIKSSPTYIRAYLCRAQAFRLIHDYKRAYLDYTRAIHLDPLNTAIYIYRGQVILEMGDLKLAAFCVQHAAFMNEGRGARKDDKGIGGGAGGSGGGGDVRFNESSSDAFGRQKSGMSALSDGAVASVSQSVTQRAVVFAFLKNYSKAIGELENDLKMKPSTAVFNLLGRVLMKAKMWAESVSAFDKSIELNSLDKASLKSFSITSSTNSFAKLNIGMVSSKEDLIEALFLRGQSLLQLDRFQEAYFSFIKVISVDPNNAQAYFYQGVSRFHLNHFKCIQDFNKALSINPNLFEAFLARACIYGIQGRYTKAVLNCNQAVKINAKSVRGFLYRGALKYLTKSYDYAIQDLTEAIRLDQACVLGFYNRALCYHQLKSYKNAIKDYSVVLMLGEYLRYKVCINRGLLYYELKDYFNALCDFSIAAKYEPEDLKIQHTIALCYHKLGRYEEAIDKFTEVYLADSTFHDALISRANVYIDYGLPEYFVKAQKDYELVLLRSPGNVDAHVNLAYLFQITGRFQKAWNQFTVALQTRPDMAAVYEGRSIVCLQMSDMAAALKDINTAIRLKKSAELFVNRGVIYQFMADNVNAMRDYQTAILIDPSYGLAYYNSANVLLFHRQFEQAVKQLDAAIDKCQMRDECTYQNRAIARALCSDASGAYRDFTEALRHCKYSSHIYMNRGLLLFKMESYELAERDFTAAINLTPNDALLYKLRADCRGKLTKRDEAIEDYKTSISIQEREELRRELLHGPKVKRRNQ